MKKNNLLKGIVFILALIAFYYFGYYSANRSFENSSQETTKSSSQQSLAPKKVYEVLDYIDKHQKAPQGYVGGRKFNNYEKLLPKVSKATNLKIDYQEWDVNPKIKGQNRGAERLVTGNDQSAYYTKDHYKSFTQIR